MKRYLWLCALVVGCAAMRQQPTADGARSAAEADGGVQDGGGVAAAAADEEFYCWHSLDELPDLGTINRLLSQAGLAAQTAGMSVPERQAFMMRASCWEMRRLRSAYPGFGEVDLRRLKSLIPSTP